MILWRHIVRVHVAPFLFSFVLMMFIFLLQFLMKFLDQLAGKGLSAAVIAELVTMNLAWMVVLAVPMAVLVSTLMAFGGLAATNQVTAMRASGVSLYRMMAPVFLASIVICGLLISFNNDVLPDANHRVRILTTDISRKKPTLTLVPGLFTQLLQGHSILVRKTFENSNDLEGVTILDYSNPSISSTITAERGRISFSPDYRKLIMDLQNGEIHQLNTAAGSQYRIIRFERHRIAMDAEGFNFQRSQDNSIQRGDREMSAAMMIAHVDSIRALQAQRLASADRVLKQNAANLLSTQALPLPAYGSSNPDVVRRNTVQSLQQQIEPDVMQAHYYDLEARRFLVEIHKKYAIPIACVVFVLIGAPLGIMARRGTFGVGASLSLGFFLLYWACLIGGEKLADRGMVSPWLGMWIANIVLGVIGVYLTIRTARENLFINWSAMSRFVPKAWRSDAPPPQTP